MSPSLISAVIAAALAAVAAVRVLTGFTDVKSELGECRRDRDNLRRQVEVTQRFLLGLLPPGTRRQLADAIAAAGVDHDQEQAA